MLSAGVVRHEVFREAAHVRAREVETETQMIMHASNSRPGLSSSSASGEGRATDETRE